MGRMRRIRDDDILDAAERVVLRLGACGLSIDAVAQEAGVSKSRVVYDHKSKSALLEALIDRQLSTERDRVAEAVAGNSNSSHPALFARIAVAREVPDEADRAIVLAVCASASSAEELQKPMREWMSLELDAMADGHKPEAATMAYLALTGFYSLEIFGDPRWTPTQRLTLLDGIMRIYASYPDSGDDPSINSNH